jgi:hypothetical protein
MSLRHALAAFLGGFGVGFEAAAPILDLGWGR